MAAAFAIYVRVSEVGGREGESFGSPEEQEAAARTWADRLAAGVYFNEDECVDLDVSGGLAATDRKLGRLIERCEAGEFGGIIVRYEDRFARDVVEGGVALSRLVECGARLIATATGFDSENLTPDKKMVFNIMMSVGQAQRERNRDARMAGKERAVKRGVWCGVAPFGYDRVEGRLVPNENAETVRELFRRRADGTGFSELARRFPNVTRSGIAKITRSRSYLGEQYIPNPKKKGQPQLATEYPGHTPLVTEAEWQAANAVTGRAPVHTGLSETVALKDIVRCGLCERAMHVLRYGKEGDRKTYACTSCGKLSMRVDKIEPAVLRQLDIALEEHEPHVAAVIQGDTRYADALAAVEQAQADLVMYRDSLDIQRELGAAGFAAGLKVRKEAIETARRALREVPRPFEKMMTKEEFEQLDARLYYPRLIAEVRVYPRSAEHRLTMRWQGQDEAWPVPPVPTVDLKKLLDAAA
jgi:DNA invertase Pin-like site-specific DNA recombinase